jgi:hypothetical protein
MSLDDEDTTPRTPREDPGEELTGEVGVGTDGSLRSAHGTPEDEAREGYGVGTDGSLGGTPPARANPGEDRE